MEADLRLIGLGASPYTRKLRGALRFRRIPYRFVIVGSPEERALPDRPLPLLPGLSLPKEDGSFETLSDTTPILNRLDDEFPERRLRPRDPALSFLDALLEDYGDEWLSKCMFHYRWSRAADTFKASAYMPYGQAISMAKNVGEQFQKAIGERQISRIGVVGSNETTAPIIEASWERYLQIFDDHLQNQPYLLGKRPGAGDFACFGQMTMLVITDPTPMEIALRISPRAYAWTEKLEDLSGLDAGDEDWIDLREPPATLTALLSEVGRVHVPHLLINAEAVAAGAYQVDGTIDGARWVQEPFAYQAKCLRWLRERFAALPDGAQERVRHILSGTGCEPLTET